jgi:hypothetical protein
MDQTITGQGTAVAVRGSREIAVSGFAEADVRTEWRRGSRAATRMAGARR